MPPGCVYTCSCWRLVAIGVPLHQWCLLGVNMGIYIIGVGLALLVSTYKAMRRPLNREASDSAGLHAFFMSLL